MKETYQIATALYEAGLRAGKPPDICGCCGARVPEGVQGCCAQFAALCGRGYTDPAYAGGIFYAVDAHALQHPEIHGKKSNAAHLLRLHWIFSRGMQAQAASIPPWWQYYLQGQDIPLLAPPADRGGLTVLDILAADRARRGVDASVGAVGLRGLAGSPRLGGARANPATGLSGVGCPAGFCKVRTPGGPETRRERRGSSVAGGDDRGARGSCRGRKPAPTVRC